MCVCVCVCVCVCTPAQVFCCLIAHVVPYYCSGTALDVYASYSSLKDVHSSASSSCPPFDSVTFDASHNIGDWSITTKLSWSWEAGRSHPAHQLARNSAWRSSKSRKFSVKCFFHFDLNPASLSANSLSRARVVQAPGQQSKSTGKLK